MVLGHEVHSRGGVSSGFFVLKLTVFVLQLTVCLVAAVALVCSVYKAEIVILLKTGFFPNTELNR